MLIKLLLNVSPFSSKILTGYYNNYYKQLLKHWSN